MERAHIHVEKVPRLVFFVFLLWLTHPPPHFFSWTPLRCTKTDRQMRGDARLPKAEQHHSIVLVDCSNLRWRSPSLYPIPRCAPGWRNECCWQRRDALRGGMASFLRLLHICFLFVCFCLSASKVRIHSSVLLFFFHCDGSPTHTDTRASLFRPVTCCACLGCTSVAVVPIRIYNYSGPYLFSSLLALSLRP